MKINNDYATAVVRPLHNGIVFCCRSPPSHSPLITSSNQLKKK